MPVFYYIYFAVGAMMVGLIATFAIILASAYYGIDLTSHIWITAIPVILAVLCNVLFIEIFRKYHKK
ncbi:MAG: hypothetical protein Q7R57_10355 [Dehalococcoidales bacterium]|nr:hypothetical protein [Dehalococcoidales bacterium]